MSTGELLGRVLAFALALVLFVAAYYGAFVAWAVLLDAAGDWSLESAERADAVVFVLIACVLWSSLGALIGRWWVTSVPLVPYAWERGRELVEFGEIGSSDSAYAYETWLVIAVCALGIGCGVRVRAARRDAV